jgi:hypothetical protein
LVHALAVLAGRIAGVGVEPSLRDEGQFG